MILCRKDRKGDALTNPITISGGSYTIDGNATVTMNQINNPSLTFYLVVNNNNIK
jgi:hypothetical protein